MRNVILYVGPSAFGVQGTLDLSGIDVSPPVRRGDVERLVLEAEGPGTVIICDGVFQVAPSVSHREILLAIDKDWAVWGVSSMGAIRAHELRFEGMHGFGYVYRQFSRRMDFTDDELCLLHFPEDPYFPLTEALVNVRYALDRMPEPLRGHRDGRRRLLRSLSDRWFGDRTEDAIREAFAQHMNFDSDSVNQVVEWIKRNRIKSLDLQSLLRRRPWQSKVKETPISKCPSR